MEVTIDTSVIEKLSSKGVLAYIAVVMADGTEASTAALASLVRVQTAVMLEGLKELCVVVPERVAKTQNKWRCGVVKAGAGEVLQTLDSETERRKEFIDDLKKAWEWANPGLSFTMMAMDGAAINRFLRTHKDWTKLMWKRALFNRFTSELVNTSQSLCTWIGRLEEYTAFPLDRFGKRMVNGGGKHGEAASIRERNREAVAAAVSHA
jgi:hypothetical protein